MYLQTVNLLPVPEILMVAFMWPLMILIRHMVLPAEPEAGKFSQMASQSFAQGTVRLVQVPK
jgi:hypothetical protein